METAKKSELGRNPELAADARADRRTMLVVAGMVALSLLTQIGVRTAEVERAALSMLPHEIWVQELTSHLGILGLSFLIPLAINRAPLELSTWRWALPAHIGFAAGFTALHVFFMAATREIAYPLIVGAPYVFNLLSPSALLYEFQKDIFIYGLMLFAFVAVRLIEQRRLEASAAIEAARKDHRITLKSGGRTFMVRAEEILWAKAAANYVEVQTKDESIFARMTLTSLERALEQAGDNHLRVHRSYLINKTEVREVSPTGEGDVTIRLTSGDEIPGSRRYREKLTPPSH